MKISWGVTHPRWYLLAPVLLLLTAVVLLPQLTAVWMSLLRYQPGRASQFVGLDNYRYLLQQPEFLWSVARNILFVVLVVGLELLVATSLALALAAGFPWPKLTLALLCLPMAISPAGE